MSKLDLPFLPLNICLLTVSDSRTQATDTSGDLLQQLLLEAGHRLYQRELLPDNLYRLRALVSHWIADEQAQVVLISGGTGLTGRDNTPQAILPLLDKQIEGFGELFRQLSFIEIGTSTLQSRAFGGLANGTLIFGLPGSTNACRTAWNGILQAQLDRRHKPCNFAALLPRFTEDPLTPACTTRN